MSRVEHILLQDEDEQHAPPSQPMLMLGYVAAGNNRQAMLYLAVVTEGELDRESGMPKYTKVAEVAVHADTFEKALALLKSGG